MPTYSIKLQADTIAAIKHRGDTACALIARDLADEANGVIKIMSHYCQDDRGTPVSDSLVVSPDTIGLSEGNSGTAIVEFQEYAYYGCDNMDVLDDREVEVPFVGSIVEGNLTLDVPESSSYSYWHRGEDTEE